MTKKDEMFSRRSQRLNKRESKPIQRLSDEQTQERINKENKKKEEEIKRLKKIENAKKLQEKMKLEKKMKQSIEKAKSKRSEAVNKRRASTSTSSSSSSKTPSKRGRKSTSALSSTTTTTTPSKRKSTTPKAKKISAGSFIASPPASSFGFDFSTSTAQRSIQARTEVNLDGYNYGVENTTAPNQLDLVFCLDCTASMGSVIRSCQDSIVSMVNTIIASEGQDIRFCLIPYRDHHITEEYCTKVYPFTRDTNQMLKNVNSQSAGGGGDGPESVTAAMFEAVCLDWREKASKIVIFMADAGPHGLEPSGDSYPNGDPDGKDPLSIAREMITLGISVYPIIAVGASSWSRPAQIVLDFYAAIATITGGQCLNLSDTSLLSDCIISGIQENIDLESNLSKVREHLDQASTAKGSALTEDEISAITSSVTVGEGKKPRSLPDDKLIKITFDKFSQVTAASTFADLKIVWNSLAGTVASSGPIITETSTARMARMAVARETRSTDPVMIECVKEGSKIRAKVISPGYNPLKNCQFPREIREEGKKFMVDAVIDAGSFYRVKGNIVPI